MRKRIKLIFCLTLWMGTISFLFAQGEKKILRTGNEAYDNEAYVDAELSYRKSLAENPEYNKAEFNLGTSLYRQGAGRMEDAQKSFEKIIKSTDDQLLKSKAHYNIGNIHMNNQQYEDAFESYKNALRTNPSDESARYNLEVARKLIQKERENEENQDQDKDDKEKDQDEKEKDSKDEDNGEGGEDKEQQDNQEGGEDKDKPSDDKNEEGDKSDGEKDDKKGDEGNEEKDKKDKGEGDKNNDENQKDPNEGGEGKPEEREGELSPQAAARLLDALENEENKVQQKINAKKLKGEKVKIEKDW